jgi:lipoic acid synthetase
MDKAIEILSTEPCDVFNHNLETVPRLYKQARPGAEYQHSLTLLQSYRKQNSKTTTKSGLMLGLGEQADEIQQVMQDLYDHGCSMLTLGQYLQPSKDHLPVKRYVTPEEFDELGKIATQIGFANVASAPLVRSSYHADLQAKNI